MILKIMEKSVTTTMSMINQTYLNRGKALELGLDYCLKDVPDATHVAITVYKWVDEEPEEPIPNPRFMGPPSRAFMHTGSDESHPEWEACKR
jgi:hypothetical protein